jgi:hypothetical protein
MELLLNFAWVLLAALLFCLWLGLAPGTGTGTSRRMQLVALAVLLLILFPVISVTDDLQAVQNPAEADCMVRRDHPCSTPHATPAPITALPLPVVAGLSFGVLSLAIPGSPQDPVINHPALAPIESRPPPAA